MLFSTKALSKNVSFHSGKLFKDLSVSGEVDGKFYNLFIISIPFFLIIRIDEIMYRAKINDTITLRHC